MLLGKRTATLIRYWTTCSRCIDVRTIRTCLGRSTIVRWPGGCCWSYGSGSDDFERAMLKKLKEKYDPELGMGDRMFNDLALSRDVLREYRSRFSQTVTLSDISIWDIYF
ncbi:hypothetical protein SCLCIDRAFT_759346 [Scleroderma citrinum Foug A]|uniref:Uncharacterized protein n=1 Tax=Scleroderma citrinum Foug A TaxID=1036808 RepID=A0A0C2ZCQ1_9AGAM|nr:hypothetical protein SCLCIDRAFT_759346 [Scleroderma citrinum Foug A]